MLLQPLATSNRSMLATRLQVELELTRLFSPLMYRLEHADLLKYVVFEWQ